MKKTKLLIPLLGLTSVSATIAPLVGCSMKYTKDDLEVSIINVNEIETPSANLKIDDYEIDKEGNLILHIKWTNPGEGTNYYYPYLTTIQIDNAIIVQKSIICPHGFTILKYSSDIDGYDISIPAIHLKRGSKIEIDVDLQQPTSAYDAYCNNAGEYTYSGVTFDVVQSTSIPTIEGGKRAWFAVDLTQFVDSMQDNEPIYFGIEARDTYSSHRVLIGMDKLNIGGVYIGEEFLAVSKPSESQYSSWIEIAAPSCGWKSAAPYLITGHYTFNKDWRGAVFMFGQPKQNP